MSHKVHVCKQLLIFKVSECPYKKLVDKGDTNPRSGVPGTSVIKESPIKGSDGTRWLFHIRRLTCATAPHLFLGL